MFLVLMSFTVIAPDGGLRARAVHPRAEAKGLDGVVFKPSQLWALGRLSALIKLDPEPL